MSRVWFTSDIHLGHSRVAEIRGYPDVETHDAEIMLEWTRVVKPEDTVYVLGDIAVSKYKNTLELIKLLPGRKHLISGNHDIIHPMHTRGQSRAEMALWLETFETVQTYLRKKLNGHEFLMSHFPYESWGDGEHREGNRYIQYRLPDLDIPLLHGHTHGTETYHDNMLHVGWDAWGTLLSQEQVIEWLDWYNEPLVLPTEE